MNGFIVALSFTFFATQAFAGQRPIGPCGPAGPCGPVTPQDINVEFCEHVASAATIFSSPLLSFRQAKMTSWALALSWQRQQETDDRN